MVERVAQVAPIDFDVNVNGVVKDQRTVLVGMTRVGGQTAQQRSQVKGVLCLRRALHGEAIVPLCQ